MVPNRRASRGYTLTEIAVAIVILGIAVAFSVPNFQRSMNRARFDRCAGELQSDVRLALSAAKARGRTIRISFDATGYTVMDAADSSVIRDRDFGQQVALAADGSPLIFPWGLVQPAQVNIQGSHYNKSYRILPTGKIELDEGN